MRLRTGTEPSTAICIIRPMRFITTLTDRPVADFGAGIRLYAGKYVSFRVDVRDYMFITSGDVQSELWIAGSICLGLGRRKSGK